MEEKDRERIADFLFEAGVLSKTPRSGFHFLGGGKQSVAEHINRTTYVGYALAKMNGKCDVGKVLEMCLFHDFPEARTSDLNYVHQKYLKPNTEKAVEDMIKELSFGKDIEKIIKEFEKKETVEALLTKDADQLELLLCLKELIDMGHGSAETWVSAVVERLKTHEGKELAGTILKTRASHWWYDMDNKDWWVDRKIK